MPLASTSQRVGPLPIAFPLVISLLIVLFWYKPNFPLNPWDGENRATIEDRVAQFGKEARERWRPFFEAAGASYPPERLVLAAFKEEKRLEVYAEQKNGSLQFIRRFPILAASGELGPKLQQGDYQVPEGMYRIESLNPNSRFHVSLRVNYPNAADKAQAKRDGRTQLGGDIMIHGNAVSIGCLAMGNEAAEDLFVLATDTGISKIKVLLAPVDFRKQSLPRAYEESLKPWVVALYASLKAEVSKLPLPPS